jgi:hypothetical protein
MALMRGERLAHKGLDFIAGIARSDDTVDVGHPCAPAAVFCTLVDDDVHRTSPHPVRRRIDASAPGDWGVESFPATVTVRVQICGEITNLPKTNDVCRIYD